MPPRVAPGGRREVGRFAWGFSRLIGVAARTNPPNLFLTMARRPRLFRSWLRFAGRMMPFGKLPKRDTELVILRVAHLRSCAYEFEQHVRIGKRAGVTVEDVERVRQGPAAEGWTPHERVVLTATDELHDRQDLTDGTWTELRAEYAEADVVEFVLLVGHYEMLATFLLTLRVEPDRRR
jgi:AhpD family alkylhydroperoxidase